MKKLSALVLAVLLLSGCAAAPAETTAGTEPAGDCNDNLMLQLLRLCWYLQLQGQKLLHELL